MHSLKATLGIRLLSQRSVGIDHARVALFVQIRVVRHVSWLLLHHTGVASVRLVLQRESLLALLTVFFTIVIVIILTVVISAIVLITASIRPVVL